MPRVLVPLSSQRQTAALRRNVGTKFVRKMAGIADSLDLKNCFNVGVIALEIDVKTAKHPKLEQLSTAAERRCRLREKRRLHQFR